jgi:hypothetical protein
MVLTLLVIPLLCDLLIYYTVSRFWDTEENIVCSKLHWCELQLHNFIEISVDLEIKISILITTLLFVTTGLLVQYCTSQVAIHMRSDVYSQYGFEKLVTLPPHMRSTALAECRIQSEAWVTYH